MNRLIVGLAAASALTAAGFSKDEATVDTPKAPPQAIVPAPPQTTPGGSALTGEVSGLTGEITGFRVEETATQTIVELAADVLFAFDKADLSPGAPRGLARTAELIRAGGAGAIAVRGYTDAKGEDAYNLDLSRRRAQAVANWLCTTGGVDASRLTPAGLGEADPVAPNQKADGTDDPAGRALNRRVTVVIPKP